MAYLAWTQLLEPAGHDPRRRRPWGSAVFEIPGRPWSPANGQYTIDRDGYPVLTSDGRPVGHLEDEAGTSCSTSTATPSVPIEVPRVPECSSIRGTGRV